MSTIEETIPPPRIRSIGSWAALIDGEDSAEFLDFRERMLRALDPSGAQETALAEIVVAGRWRLGRIPTLEARLLTAPNATVADLSQLSLYELRLTRVVSQERAVLSQLQAARRARPVVHFLQR